MKSDILRFESLKHLYPIRYLSKASVVSERVWSLMALRNKAYGTKPAPGDKAQKEPHGTALTESPAGRAGPRFSARAL